MTDPFTAAPQTQKKLEPAAYEVVGVKDAGRKQTQHGSILAKLYISLQNAQGARLDEVYFQPQEANIPQTGDAIYGILELGEYGWRFRREQRPENGDQSFSAPQEQAFGANEAVPGQVSVRPPENPERRSIEAQVALKAATEYGLHAKHSPEAIAENTVKFAQAIREAATS